MSTLNIEEAQESKLEPWFDNLIGHLRADQVQIETGVANSEKKKFYDAAMSKDAIKMAETSYEYISKIIVSGLIKDYLENIQKRKVEFKKLAFDLRRNKILVWAEVKKGDEDSEAQLYLAESEVNNKNQGDFFLSTMVVEDSDNIPTPDHYTSYS